MEGIFLIGSSEDLLGDGLYPLTFVHDIRKEDLLRVARDGIVIIDLLEKKYFDPKNNNWKSVDKYTYFSDRWNQNL